MLAFTKRRTIAVAAALGIALSLSLPIAAFADPAPSNTAARSRTAPALHSGDLVRVRSGGPLMTVTGVQGDQVNCSWTNWDGRLEAETFSVSDLTVPLTMPRTDSDFEDAQAFDRK